MCISHFTITCTLPHGVDIIPNVSVTLGVFNISFLMYHKKQGCSLLYVCTVKHHYGFLCPWWQKNTRSQGARGEGNDYKLPETRRKVRFGLVCLRSQLILEQVRICLEFTSSAVCSAAALIACPLRAPHETVAKPHLNKDEFLPCLCR